MARIVDLIKTSQKVIPMIYAYTTPGIPYHDGCIKIGYTEQDVDHRIWEQTHTAGIKAQKEWQGTATYDDGTGTTFKDTDFHNYLRKNGVKQPQETENDYFDASDNNEWFCISPDDSHAKFNQFRAHKGLKDEIDIAPYILREEQERAVNMTVAYMQNHENGSFLWNAKPRFGKTLATYDLIKRVNAQKVLIVTNRPAIANSWYDDYQKFIGRQGGYFFASRVDGIVGRPLVIPYSSYEKDEKSRQSDPSAQKMGLFYFVSLQDLKGSNLFGGNEGVKLKEIQATEWDVLVIDEAHEGVDTYKTDTAFRYIRRKFTLHLSGTPFKALASDKFPEDAIFNWTYADEQASKKNWKGPANNPYETLPQLNLLTYQMSEIIKDEISQGIEINGEIEDFAFDLNEFFAVKENGGFVHDSSVDKFLDALVSQEKFPFSSLELRNELRHTFWLLNRVDSAKALAKKLEEHSVFKEYKVILAVGNGKIDDTDETKKSYDKVVNAIKKYDKTITLSVGQLTTGVTIPEWTAVLMLSNIKSPALYMQSAFRAQNPCLFYYGPESTLRKKNAYVFDFDPARTLITFEQFANDLMKDTAGGHGDVETRKRHVKELLNFFPVIGEDEEGEMIQLDAEKVLSIPRKIKSQEVVKRGFMSNFLFQNIFNVFHAPKEVVEIIKKLTPTKEAKKDKKEALNPEKIKEITVDEDGNATVSDSVVIGLEPEIFGDKIYTYKEGEDLVVPSLEEVSEKPSALKEHANRLKELANDNASKMVETAKAFYNNDISKSMEKQLVKQISEDVNNKIDHLVDDYKIKTTVYESKKQEALDNLLETGKTEQEVEEEFAKQKQDAFDSLQQEFQKAVAESFVEAKKNIIKTVETKKKDNEKDSIESKIRDNLRGFSRTIPSFLMAYGDETFTLDTLDQKVPAEVFKEVTDITIQEFRLLRDGGDCKDEETGETVHYEGHLFDPVVFNDSVKEFLRKKQELANYFDENSKEDIFNYIPPQKTNQIFTPRWLVKEMTDMLEKENPGCFDDPTKTFADLYIKSGMYIAEIVIRLYRSEKMKKLYPDNAERLNHIFAKQVYGCAPTEIIYRICLNYLLGFTKTVPIEKHNIKLCDTLKLSKTGTLEKELEKLFNL